MYEWSFRHINDKHKGYDDQYSEAIKKACKSPVKVCKWCKQAKVDLNGHMRRCPRRPDLTLRPHQEKNIHDATNSFDYSLMSNKAFLKR